MALGNRIRYYREKAGLTLEQLSERSGVDVGTISALENRDSSRSKFATPIAKALGMSVEALEDEAQDLDVATLMSTQMTPGSAIQLMAPVAPPAFEEPMDGYIRLPIMAEASAGSGRVAPQEVIRYVDVLEGYIQQRLRTSPANVKVLTARGTSMTGLIEDGDIMFVQPTNEFTDDGIYILTLDDLIRVKRLSVSITTGKVVIESNDGRAPEELPLKEVPHRLHIQGRVLGSWSLRSFA